MAPAQRSISCGSGQVKNRADSVVEVTPRDRLEHPCLARVVWQLRHDTTPACSLSSTPKPRPGLIRHDKEPAPAAPQERIQCRPLFRPVTSPCPAPRSLDALSRAHHCLPVAPSADRHRCTPATSEDRQGSCRARVVQQAGCQRAEEQAQHCCNAKLHNAELWQPHRHRRAYRTASAAEAAACAAEDPGGQSGGGAKGGGGAESGFASVVSCAREVEGGT